MKKKYVNYIIYSSVFCFSYGIFFYHRYSSEHIVSASSTILDVQTEKFSTIISLQKKPLKSDYKNTEVSDDAEYKIHDGTDFSVKNPSFKVRRRDTDRYEPATKITSSQKSPPYYKELPNYSVETRNIRSMPSSSVSLAVPSYSQNSGLAYNTSASSSNLPVATPSTADKDISDQNIAESDGSEFLPDGSSQQDLFISRSKNPRVYTIKNYQTADISCTPGFGESSAHAALIRGLKGC